MGRFAKAMTLLSSAARTSSSYSDYKDLGSYNEMIMILDVTAASGTDPTLDITLQFSADAQNWYDDPEIYFSQIYGVTSKIARATNFGKYVRWKYTIGGTDASFTFSLNIIAKD